MTYSFLELFLINPGQYLHIKEIPNINTNSKRTYHETDTNRCTFSLVSDTDVEKSRVFFM